MQTSRPLLAELCCGRLHDCVDSLQLQWLVLHHVPRLQWAALGVLYVLSEVIAAGCKVGGDVCAASNCYLQMLAKVAGTVGERGAERM
jgi:hypothetical protein